jgi:hypothetical protein
MRSTRLAPPFLRVHATKRVLGTVRKSVVGLVHCSCTILLGRIPLVLLLFRLPVGGAHEVAIGSTFIRFV